MVTLLHLLYNIQILYTYILTAQLVKHILFHNLTHIVIPGAGPKTKMLAVGYAACHNKLHIYLVYLFIGGHKNKF